MIREALEVRRRFGWLQAILGVGARAPGRSRVGRPYAGQSWTNDLRPSALLVEFSARRTRRPAGTQRKRPAFGVSWASNPGRYRVHLGGRRRIFDIPARRRSSPARDPESAVYSGRLRLAAATQRP